MKTLARLLTATAAVLSFGFLTSPAQGYYVIYWNNSYGGGYSYHCDGGDVYYTEGVPFEGAAYVVYWAPGQPPC